MQADLQVILGRSADLQVILGRSADLQVGSNLCDTLRHHRQLRSARIKHLDCLISRAYTSTQFFSSLITRARLTH